jgi:hypothetical protein
MSRLGSQDGGISSYTYLKACRGILFPHMNLEVDQSYFGGLVAWVLDKVNRTFVFFAKQHHYVTDAIREITAVETSLQHDFTTNSEPSLLARIESIRWRWSRSRSRSWRRPYATPRLGKRVPGS